MSRQRLLVMLFAGAAMNTFAAYRLGWRDRGRRERLMAAIAEADAERAAGIGEDVPPAA
jgi:hypothetical protein